MSRKVEIEKFLEVELSTLLEQSEIGIIISNFEGNIQYLNCHALRFFPGESKEEVIEKKSSGFMRGGKVLKINQQLESGKKHSEVIPIFCSRLGRQYFDIEYARISIAEETYIMGIIKDVSESVKNNIQIEEQRNELERYKKNLDIAVLISETDERGVITHANDHFCERSQYTAAELIGKTHKMVNSGYHPKEFWESCWKTLMRGETWQGEVCNRAKDGSLYWVESTVFPIKNRQGRITGYTSIRIDITAKKEANEKTFQHVNKLASIGELAAGVAHEINNPMMIITSSMHLMKKKLAKGEVSPQEMLSFFRRMEISSERICHIVDGLKDFSRVDHKEDVDLDLVEVVDQVYFLLRDIYRKDDVKILMDRPDTPMIIRGGFGEIQQVIMNLMSNAKFAIRKNESKEIRLELLNDNGNASIYIKDNGPGVREKNAEKIFNPFFTTKDVGEGTGMGLSLAREIIHKFDGELSLCPDFRDGACFKIEGLKLLSPHHEENVHRLEVQKEYNAKILIAEDNDDLRDLFSNLLRGAGCWVDVARNGAEGLKKVQENDFDIIITDAKMPEMSGFEFIKRAKAVCDKNIKTVLLTGEILENINAYREYFDCLVQKPFDSNKMRGILNYLLKNKDEEKTEKLVL